MMKRHAATALPAVDKSRVCSTLPPSAANAIQLTSGFRRKPIRAPAYWCCPGPLLLWTEACRAIPGAPPRACCLTCPLRKPPSARAWCPRSWRRNCADVSGPALSELARPAARNALGRERDSSSQTRRMRCDSASGTSAMFPTGRPVSRFRRHAGFSSRRAVEPGRRPCGPAIGGVLMGGRAPIVRGPP